jgi:hypothetical protein
VTGDASFKFICSPLDSQNKKRGNTSSNVREIVPLPDFEATKGIWKRNRKKKGNPYHDFSW